MRLFRLSALFTLLLILVPAYASSDNATQYVARMAGASELTSLDTPGSQNWHLKLAISLFDNKGDPQEQGTVEEWWAAQDKYKIVYQTAAYTTTELHNEQGFFHNPQARGRPSLVTELLEQVVHPLPKQDDVSNSQPELRTQDFGKASLECIMLSQPIKSRVQPLLACFPPTALIRARMF